jgi:glycosyltransferase involved in cell wall biosynthesis
LNPSRIALVGPLPPPAGGMANQTLQLAALLRGEGIEVETVQVNAPYRPAWAGRLKGARALFRLVPYLWRLWSAAGRVELFHIMANSGWSWHLFAAPAIVVARLRGCAVVVNYRGGEAQGFLRRSGFVIGLTLRRAHALIVPSAYLEAVFGEAGFAPVVVPNIIDLARFRRDGAAGPFNQDGPRLLVARNLEPIYDNATALRCFAQVQAVHPRARLTIAGSGPLLAQLEELARELGLKAVTFTGRVDNAGMAELYRQADIMLNPSLVDNTPNSVIEALASGVAVVSTNVGGVPYLVEDGRTALLVAPASPHEMADAVLRLVADPALAASLREAGLRQVQQFCWPSVRPALQQVYRSALEQAGSLAPLSRRGP